MSDKRLEILKTVDNEERERDYVITHSTDEFTFLYPVTEQPCFATVVVDYHPAEHCVEMMSLNKYFGTFREEAYYFEGITNRLLDDLAGIVRPRQMTVTARFTVRGGISTVVKARFSRE